ncbi:MAG: DUF3990 domain-containing protein [Candidatus Symbiothrix sp.]|nr:DUF3990 domain-containing protein [Candidatus Symbiothrix sp.]
MILNRDASITKNRHDYDIIEDPVADDKVQLADKTTRLYKKDWTEIYKLLLDDLNI